LEVAMQGERKAMLVRVSGRVQGVSFRIWTLEEAEKLGLSGWVRNEDDGSVKALIAGPEAAVAAMLGRFWEGPVGAMVSDVATESADAGEAPVGFRITG
jgi:acylphosphatase